MHYHRSFRALCAFLPLFGPATIGCSKAKEQPRPTLAYHDFSYPTPDGNKQEIAVLYSPEGSHVRYFIRVDTPDVCEQTFTLPAVPVQVRLHDTDGNGYDDLLVDIDNNAANLSPFGLTSRWAVRQDSTGRFSQPVSLDDSHDDP